MECPKCKGRGWCEVHPYPILAKLNATYKHKQLKEDFSGQTPNIFVGRFGYPQLHVGFLSPQDVEDATIFDAPRSWAQQNFDSATILGLRQQLVNARFQTHVKAKVRFLDAAQEVGMASKPVDIEIGIKNPKQGFEVNQFVAPLGPRGELQKISLTSNPKVPIAVERAVSDTDFKAKDAVSTLYGKQIDELFLTKLLSTGNLGVATERKLVPTRWAITAVDDMVSKHIIAELRDAPHVEPQAFFSGYLGNFFCVLVMPGPWSFELFEIMLGGDEVTVTTDYEGYGGRKEYVHETAGGYYAVRLAVLEQLKAMRRQGSVLVLRFITPAYDIPLGVWVVREAMRKSMLATPLQFGDRDLLLGYARALALRKFNIDVSDILKRSKILDTLTNQQTLGRFF